MKIYFYVDQEGRIKAKREASGHVMDVSEDSIEMARELILKHNKAINNDTLYGPFDIKYHTRDKEGY